VLGDSKLDIGSKPTGLVSILKDSTFIRDGGGTLTVNAQLTASTKDFTLKHGTILLQGGGAFSDAVVDLQKDTALTFLPIKFPKQDAGYADYLWTGRNEFKGDGETSVSGAKIKIADFTEFDHLDFFGGQRFTGQIFGDAPALTPASRRKTNPAPDPTLVSPMTAAPPPASQGYRAALRAPSSPSTVPPEVAMAALAGPAKESTAPPATPRAAHPARLPNTPSAMATASSTS
jgi:hypothetical protein